MVQAACLPGEAVTFSSLTIIDYRKLAGKTNNGLGEEIIE